MNIANSKLKSIARENVGVAILDKSENTTIDYIKSSKEISNLRRFKHVTNFSKISCSGKEGTIYSDDKLPAHYMYVLKDSTPLEYICRVCIDKTAFNKTMVMLDHFTTYCKTISNLKPFEIYLTLELPFPKDPVFSYSGANSQMLYINSYRKKVKNGELLSDTWTLVSTRTVLF